MANLNIFAGFDVSKANFDVSILDAGSKPVCGRFTNDKAGFKQALHVVPAGAHCIMEATGPYYLHLACWLHAEGFVVSVVNPLVIRRFAQSLLKRVKTDKADAALIAAYGRMHQPPAWTPPAQHIVQLQQLQALRERAITHLTALTNQLEAFSAGAMMNKEIAGLLHKMIEQQQKYVLNIDAQIERIIKQYHNDLLKNISSIPGIAKKTASVLITITGGFTRFSNYKQLCAYIGITPRIYESGSSVKGKARISKIGMSRVRAMLYLCAWSAKRCNKACKDLYERLLAKGKAKRIALIAVAHKLLRQSFAIATSNKPYLIQP